MPAPFFTLNNPVAGSAVATANGLQPYTIEDGSTVQVTNPAIAAQGSALTPQTPAFSVKDKQDGGPRNLNVSAVGVGAIPPTVTAQLLASSDGGSTWQNVGSPLTLVATSVPTQQQIAVSPGVLYAFAITTLTLGGATGVNIIVTLA